MKICHTTDMSQIPAGLNDYTMVHGLNSNKLKDKVAECQSAYWNTWKSASVIFIFLVLAMKEPRVTPELITMPQKHQ